MRKLLIIAAKSALALVSLIGLVLVIFAGWLIWHYGYGIGLPDRDKLAALSSASPACSVSDQRTYRPLSEIPPMIRQAAIAFEEPEFYERLSSNPLVEAILAAAFDRPARPSGITTVVARCLIMSLAPECCRRAIDWHIANMVFMCRVVRTLSRERILEIYLNESYFGRDSYGVGAAAMAYFNRPPGLLSVDEIAFITVLPRAPALFNRKHDVARDRRNMVIDRMLKAGIITEADAASARDRPLQLREAPPDKTIQPRNL